MRSRTGPAVVGALLVTLLVPARPGRSENVPVTATNVAELASEPIRPMPRATQGDPKVVALGAALFADARLSTANTLSCASCHDLRTNGATGNRVDSRFDGTPAPRNTLSVFNAALSFRQGWDGGEATMADQVNVSLRDAMGQEAAAGAARLAADPEAAARFRDAFGRGPDAAGVVAALVAFVQTLLTPDSPFDRWLRGDATALSAPARDGYALFKTLGCVSCHQGVNMGGNLFERSGVYAQLGDPARPMLRVPSLRNVATTAPYFHDGSAPTLARAVQMMAEAQLDRELSAIETGQLIAFLCSLTGEYEGRPVSSPASGSGGPR